MVGSWEGKEKDLHDILCVCSIDERNCLSYRVEGGETVIYQICYVSERGSSELVSPCANPGWMTASGRRMEKDQTVFSWILWMVNITHCVSHLAMCGLIVVSLVWYEGFQLIICVKGLIAHPAKQETMLGLLNLRSRFQKEDQWNSIVLFVPHRCFLMILRETRKFICII